MNATLIDTTATPWMTGFTAGFTTAAQPVPCIAGEFRDGFQYGRACALGDTHGAAGTHPYDDPDGVPSALYLLAALGETGPFTTANADRRLTLVNAYAEARDIRSRSQVTS